MHCRAKQCGDVYYWYLCVYVYKYVFFSQVTIPHIEAHATAYITCITVQNKMVLSAATYVRMYATWVELRITLQHVNVSSFWDKDTLHVTDTCTHIRPRIENHKISRRFRHSRTKTQNMMADMRTNHQQHTFQPDSSLMHEEEYIHLYIQQYNPILTVSEEVCAWTRV